MPSTICLIDGHPDPDPKRLVHALCDAYQSGAQSEGHTVNRINVAQLNIEPLRRSTEFDIDPDKFIDDERKKIAISDHLVVVFPLWLGGMPAATRAFFEQAARNAYFLGENDGAIKWPKKLMKGKSARIIVTMGMPAFAYKTIMRSGALKAFEKGMLGISGFKPIEHTILGGAGEGQSEKYERWMDELVELGRKAS